LLESSESNSFKRNFLIGFFDKNRIICEGIELHITDETGIKLEIIVEKR
jgi:hypothetical protein